MTIPSKEAILETTLVKWMCKMASKHHICERIKQQLRQRIVSGELGPGMRVPSEYELVAQSGAARSQARKALQELERDGLLVRKRGSGSYVAPQVDGSFPINGPIYETVRIVVPEYGSRYVRQILEGFMERMLANGTNVITSYEQFTDPEHEAAFLNLVDRMDVAGMVTWVINDSPVVRDALRRLRDRQFPLVLVDRSVTDLDIDIAASDNEAIGYQLTQALIERGHEAIGLVTSRSDTAHTIIEREAGYRRALEEAALPCDERFIIRLDETQTDHTRDVAGVIAHAQRPTAYVCINDALAESLETSLRQLGWTTDHGFEIACVADFEPRRGGWLPTEYIRQDGVAIGRNCAELLLARMADASRPAQHILIPSGPRVYEGPRDIEDLEPTGTTGAQGAVLGASH